MTIDAVLFDLDGTLVDSNGFHVRAWREAFEEAGHDVPDDRIAAQIGKGGDLLVPTLLPDTDDAAQEALTERHGEIFKSRYLGEVRPFPGARDLVARVHESGARIVLASSASGEELEHYVELLDIAGFVHTKTTSDDAGTSKPAPDIFAIAIERAGDPASIRAIGDSPYDIEAAGKCGVATVAVLSGGFPRERLADATAIYADVAAILAGFEDSPLAD